MLGDVRTTQQIIGTALPAAGAIATGVAVSSATTAAVASGTAASILGMSVAVAVPVIGAAIAGITFAILQFTQGCQSCVVTSNQANKIEELMKQNLSAWQASNKTCAERQQCISNFNALWQVLVDFCSNPQFGGAGKNCIGDRQEGACHFKNVDGCWNWFIGYRDSIANDSCSDALVVNNLGSPVLSEISNQISNFDIPTMLGIGLLIVGIGIGLKG